MTPLGVRWQAACRANHCLCPGVSQKKLDDPLAVKRTMIEPTHPTLSMRRQCQLLGLNRASLYRAPAQESPFNLRLMRLIDEQYTKTPFYGYPKMTFHVRALG